MSEIVQEMRDSTLESLDIPKVFLQPVIPFTKHPYVRVRNAALVALGSCCNRFGAYYLRKYYNEVCFASDTIHPCRMVPDNA